MPNICRFVHTDGRSDYLKQTWDSFDAHVKGKLAYTIIVDDSGDPAHGEYLELEYGHRASLIVSHSKRLGLAKSKQESWKIIPKDCDFVFRLEEDFVFERDVDLDVMARILNKHLYLNQIWLMRHPWYSAEIEAGSIYNLFGESNCKIMDGFTEILFPFWTNNPSLFPVRTTYLGWPDPPNSEVVFRQRLGGTRSAFLGHPSDPPITRHIGARSNKDPKFS